MSKITVYHNPNCERCRRIAKMHKRFDWLGRITVSTATPPTGALAMGEIIVKDHRDGRFLKGIDAVRAIFRQVPFYWLLLLFLRIPPVARKIDADVRGCKDDACAV